MSFYPFQKVFQISNLLWVMLLGGLLLNYTSAYGMSCYDKETSALEKKELEQEEAFYKALVHLREIKFKEKSMDVLLTILKEKGRQEFLSSLRGSSRPTGSASLLYDVLSVLNEKQLYNVFTRLGKEIAHQVGQRRDGLRNLLWDLSPQEKYRLVLNLILSDGPKRIHDFLSVFIPQELYFHLSHLSYKEFQELRNHFEQRIRPQDPSPSFMSLDIAERKPLDAQLAKDNEGVSFVVIDFETTGLKPGIEEITEVGAVRYVNGHPESSFATLVRNSDGVSSKVTELTSITNEMLEKAPRIDSVIEPLIRFIGENTVVAHRASFDTDFLRANYQRLNISIEAFNKVIEMYNKTHDTRIDTIQKIETPTGSIIDTLGLARRLYNDSDVDNYKLETLVEALGIESKGPFHRAEEDSYCCGEVFVEMIDKIASDVGLPRGDVYVALSGTEPYLFPVIDQLYKQASNTE